MISDNKPQQTAVLEHPCSTDRRPLISNITKRRDIIYFLRRFFYEQGFLEVETPTIVRRPLPEMHIEPVACDLGYLITSPEIHMKMLLSEGYEKIFQICKVFRKGEYGRLHLPEFTMLEWYRTGASYNEIMTDCTNLIRFIGSNLDLDSEFQFRNRTITYAGEPQIITVKDAFLKWAGWDPIENFNPDRFYLDLVERVEPNLGWPSPCILKDYPAPEAALSKLRKDNPLICERFELYWAGIELANGFSELNNPHEQRERFLRVIEEKKRVGQTTLELPQAFINSLKNMPDSAGIALGVDRLVMIFTGAESIHDVVLFAEEFRDVHHP